MRFLERYTLCMQHDCRDPSPVARFDEAVEWLSDRGVPHGLEALMIGPAVV